MITAASIDQVNDSLNLKSTDKKYLGSLSQKIESLKEKKDEITITIESAGIELGKDDDNVLTVPSKDDFTVNLIFTNTFKKTNGKELEIIDNNNLDELNITLPDGDFGKLKVTTTHSTALVESAGETDVEFTAVIKNKVGSLTLGKGLDVLATDKSDIASGATYKKDGATVDAMVLYSGSQKAASGGVATKISGTNVKEIIVRGSEVTLNADPNLDGVKSSPLTKVTIEEGATLKLNTAVKKIVGSLDEDGDIAATVSTSTSYLAIVESISDVTITGTATSLDIPAADFDNIQFNGFTTYNYSKDMDSAEGVKFLKENSKVNFDVPAQVDADSYTFTFKGVEFAKGTEFNVNKYWNTDKLKDAAGKDVEVTFYYWLEKDDVTDSTSAKKNITGDLLVLKNAAADGKDSTATDTLAKVTVNVEYLKKTLRYSEEEIIDSLNKKLSKALQDAKNDLTTTKKFHVKAEGKGIVAYYDANAYTSADPKMPYSVSIENAGWVYDEDRKNVTAYVKASRYDVSNYLQYSQNDKEISSWIRRQCPDEGTFWCKKAEKSDEVTDYANFMVIFAFDGCTYGKEDLSASNVKVVKPNMPSDDIKVKVRYDIDGKLYEPRETDTTGKWFLYERK